MDHKPAWSLEQRLAYLENHLFWEGRVNRRNLMAQFRVSEPQAAKDFAFYRKHQPENLVYDKRGKCFRPSPAFTPVFAHIDGEEFLSRLEGTNREATNTTLVPAMVVPKIRRHTDAEIVRDIYQTANSHESCRILYQSMSEKSARWRWISPHAFAFDGQRWHTRAWDSDRQVFRDFVLSRILRVGERNDIGRPREADEEWKKSITVHLIPNPGLSFAQQEVIKLDYHMTDGGLSIEVNKALLFYFLTNYGLDFEDEKAARVHPIVVENYDEVAEYLKPHET